jgi:hypothetical protein
MLFFHPAGEDISTIHMQNLAEAFLRLAKKTVSKMAVSSSNETNSIGAPL